MNPDIFVTHILKIHKPKNFLIQQPRKNCVPVNATLCVLDIILLLSLEQTTKICRYAL